jgi:hypothetical protein
MTTRNELDNRMEAESYLISKGVLSPRRRTPSGDAAEAELTKALEEHKNSDLPLTWVRGRGWIPDPDLYTEALKADSSAAKPR